LTWSSGGFTWSRNATTFDVFYWLQVTNFDVRLLNSAPNGPDNIDIVGLCLHAQMLRRKVRPDRSSCQALNSARETMQSCCQSEIADQDVAALVAEIEAIGEDPEKFKAFVNAAESAV